MTLKTRLRADQSERPLIRAKPRFQRHPRSITLTELLADVGHQGHEAGPLDGQARRPLKRGAVARALAAEQLTLAGAHLLERLNVLVIHKGRPRAAFLRAEPAAALAAFPKLLPNHYNLSIALLTDCLR